MDRGKRHRLSSTPFSLQWWSSAYAKHDALGNPYACRRISMLSLLKPQKTRTITITVWTRILYSIGFQSFPLHTDRFVHIHESIFTFRSTLDLSESLSFDSETFHVIYETSQKTPWLKAAFWSCRVLTWLRRKITLEDVGGRYSIRVHSTTENSLTRNRETSRVPCVWRSLSSKR